jgi:hypothetical protein
MSGTAAKPEELDTPTLVECWRTAPYLYDGSAVTMEQLLARHGREGEVRKLTAHEIEDLAAFVRSL